MRFPILDGVKRGVFAYLTAPADTEVTLAGTYYPIEGTFTNDPFENFSVGSGGIQYDGRIEKTFEIDWHATLYGDSPGITVSAGIRIDGVIATASLMTTYLKTNGEAQALSGTEIVKLQPGQEVELVLTADGAGDKITVVNFTTSITKFFVL